MKVIFTIKWAFFLALFIYLGTLIADAQEILSIDEVVQIDQIFDTKQYYDFSMQQEEYFSKNQIFEQVENDGKSQVDVYMSPAGAGYVEVYYYDNKIEYVAYGPLAKDLTRTEYLFVSSSTKPIVGRELGIY